jgi:hypothetical protein
MKEVWILFVMFAHIGAYDRPGSRDLLFKPGPEYPSYKECTKSSSEWITEEIKRLDFDYDWKFAICSNGDIDAYKYPVQLKNKGVQVNYNAMFDRNSMYKNGTY